MKRRTLIALAATATAAGVGFYLYRGDEGGWGSRDARPQTPAPRISAEARLQELELPTAIKLGKTRARFQGNGRNWLRASVTNSDVQELLISFPHGLVFEAGSSQMVLARTVNVRIPAGAEQSLDLPAAASRSTNSDQLQPYWLAGSTLPKLAAFLAAVEARPELPMPAIQTAVLSLAENLPLGVFAQFPLLAGSPSESEDDGVFRVETRYICMALLALKEIGYPIENLALAVDPQLQAEAMIDPLAHSLAMKFYDLKPGEAWNYWQKQLTLGDRRLRHYALHGIARYYPSVALRMLPQWARERRLEMHLRESAVRALAETSLPEAIPVLNHLDHHFEHEPALRRAARETVSVLIQWVYNPWRFSPPVAFRATLPEPLPLPAGVAPIPPEAVLGDGPAG